MVSAHPTSDPGGEGRVGSDLPLRVISAVALVPVALGTAYLGGWAFVMLWLAAALVVLWEWNCLVAPAVARRLTITGGVALVAAVLAIAHGRPELGLLMVVAGGAWTACTARTGGRVWPAFGVFYAAGIVIPAILLRADAAYGFAALILLFAVVWGTDIAAYFGGRLIGGPRLWPRVTPKKTWSGAVAGAAIGTLAGVGVASIAGLRNLAAAAAICLVLSITSQAGDLLESAIKRRFGKKDASKLIPGHGGLMDRLDGFVAAALLATVVGISRGGGETPASGLLVW